MITTIPWRRDSDRSGLLRRHRASIHGHGQTVRCPVPVLEQQPELQSRSVWTVRAVVGAGSTTANSPCSGSLREPSTSAPG